MSNDFLHRDDAPFSEGTWAAIDNAVVGAAKSQLTARRLLQVDGPHGLGLKSIPLGDVCIGCGPDDPVCVQGASALPLITINASFRLAARDVAAYEQRGVPMDLTPAIEAALACARQEDDLLFNGMKAIAMEGLLTAKEAQSQKLKSWEQVGAAVEDIITAVTKLDSAGFHGPYTLALAAGRYNALFRRYPNGPMTELEHMRELVTDGIVKAASIKEGGVLVASGPQYVQIVLGQDLAAGFVGPEDRNYALTVSESIALRLLVPAAVVVLK